MQNTNRKKYAPFHAVRVSHEAFCRLHEKANEEMKNGVRVNIGEIASRIIEGAK